MQSSVFCSQCKKGLITFKDNHLICSNKSCYYVQKSPITYENDINAYDVEDKVMNRFSEFYTPAQASAQNQRIHCDNLKSNFDRGKKFINDCGYALKVSQNITGEALTMLTSIIKALQSQKRLNNSNFFVEISNQSFEGDEQPSDKKKKGKNQRYKNKNIFAIRFLSAYSLQAVCFQKGNYFQQFNIIKQMSISLKEWRDVNKQMNAILRNYISFQPMIQPKHIVLKVCKKRHINDDQKTAMVQMCERIGKYSTADVRTHTIAAIAFWKICQFSSRYSKRIDLRHVCKNHDRLIEKGLENQTYGFFDITPQNVRKVYKEYIKAEFYSKYLPQWPSRVPLTFDSKGNLEDFD